MKIAAALGIAISLLFPAAGNAAESFGSIRGHVVDSSGTPVVGALVIAAAAASALGERMAFTDSQGTFVIPNLLLGQYSVKVTMARFLPALQNGVQLTNGKNPDLRLNLQTAIDVLRNAGAYNTKNAEDMIWVLRSSRGTQPVMRLARQNSGGNDSWGDYYGYLQISRSMETDRASSENVGSRFSLTMPLQNHGKVTVDGQYNESPDLPRGLSASYAFSPAAKHQSQVSLNMRQGTSIDGYFTGSDFKEIQIKYSEKLQLLNHLVVHYGAETGRTIGIATDQYFRPDLKVSFVPNALTTISAQATAETPSRADDPIRGKDYFEQQSFLMLPHQTYRHAEFNASRVSGTTKVSAAVFRDLAAAQTLFVSLSDGSRKYIYFDRQGARTNGVRFFVNREFKNFDAGVGYTVASGLDVVSRRAATPAEILEHLEQRQHHVVTARIKTDVDFTKTQFTAVYRWVSPQAVTSIDPYQTNVEYNDPTLSISVAQNLPTWGAFPGKVQAILDARNLLEQPAGSRTVQISNAPRFVKGGINIRF